MSSSATNDAFPTLKLQGIIYVVTLQLCPVIHRYAPMNILNILRLQRIPPFFRIPLVPLPSLRDLGQPKWGKKVLTLGI